MPTGIYHISALISILTNIVTLLIGVFYCYRSQNPSYMRIFPVYLFISAAVEFFADADILTLFRYRPFGNYHDYVASAIYNLYTPFELFIFAWFLLRIIRSAMIKRLVIGLLTLYCLFFIIYSVRLDIRKNSNMISIILENVIIIIPCLTWYRELFTRSEPVNLYREPAFWLVTGIFFYLATVTPFYVASIYLISHRLRGLFETFSSINNISLMITYMLFIKGFTCRIRRS